MNSQKYLEVSTFPTQKQISVLIVMPVFRGLEITERAIDSALANNSNSCFAKLLVINDQSPEPTMAAMLSKKLSQYGDCIEIITNSKNLGFVRSANIGLLHKPASDIALVNNDIVLPTNWLQQLVIDAYSQEKIGTVTPFSNNTTISAFPNFNEENKIPFGMDLETINEIFSANRVEPIETPTAVGFCMFIKRKCINEVGIFDFETFNMGYGEENDFCQRAILKGWSNVISPNLYVEHVGSVSFGQSRNERVAEGTNKLIKKHPNYIKDVQRFNSTDPLRTIRITRLMQLIQASNLPVIVHLSHGLGGGVEQHINDLVALHYGLACSIVIEPTSGKCSLNVKIEQSTNNMVFEIQGNESISDLLKLLGAIGVTMVHYHHLRNVPSKLLDGLQSLKCRVVFTAHDFHLLPKSQTNFTLDLSASNTGFSAKEFLLTCDQVIFPSKSCQETFLQSFEIIKSVSVAHPEVIPLPPPRNTFQKKDVYIIAVLGAINREKGAELLDLLAKDSLRNNKKWRFLIIGYSYRKLGNVSSTGPYEQSNIDHLIAENNCDLIFFPARTAETYSYTLSAAMRSQLPIFAPNIGAFPERLSNRKMTRIFESTQQSNNLMDELQSFIDELECGLTPSAPAHNSCAVDVNFYSHAYFGLGNLTKMRQYLDLFQQVETVLRSEVKPSFNLKERLLRFTWNIYVYSPLASLLARLPLSLKRSIKRRLSTRPIHEVVREHSNTRTKQ
jgi:GT2 family glycosyltransferase